MRSGGSGGAVERVYGRARQPGRRAPALTPRAAAGCARRRQTWSRAPLPCPLAPPPPAAAPAAALRDQSRGCLRRRRLRAWRASRWAASRRRRRRGGRAGPWRQEAMQPGRKPAEAAAAAAAATRCSRNRGASNLRRAAQYKLVARRGKSQPSRVNNGLELKLLVASAAVRSAVASMVVLRDPPIGASLQVWDHMGPPRARRMGGAAEMSEWRRQPHRSGSREAAVLATLVTPASMPACCSCSYGVQHIRTHQVYVAIRQRLSKRLSKPRPFIPEWHPMADRPRNGRMKGALTSHPADRDLPPLPLPGDARQGVKAGTLPPPPSATGHQPRVGSPSTDRWRLVAQAGLRTAYWALVEPPPQAGCDRSSAVEGPSRPATLLLAEQSQLSGLKGLSARLRCSAVTAAAAAAATDLHCCCTFHLPALCRVGF